MRSSDRLVRLAGRRDSCGNGWNPLHEVHAWFTRLVPSAIVVVTYGAAFVLMPQVLKQAMKTGVVDTIWSGAGVALVTAIGALFLNERRTLGQVGGVAPHHLRRRRRPGHGDWARVMRGFRSGAGLRRL